MRTLLDVSNDSRRYGPIFQRKDDKDSTYYYVPNDEASLKCFYGHFFLPQLLFMDCG